MHDHLLNSIQYIIMDNEKLLTCTNVLKPYLQTQFDKVVQIMFERTDIGKDYSLQQEDSVCIELLTYHLDEILCNGYFMKNDIVTQTKNVKK